MSATAKPKAAAATSEPGAVTYSQLTDAMKKLTDNIRGDMRQQIRGLGAELRAEIAAASQLREANESGKDERKQQQAETQQPAATATVQAEKTAAKHTEQQRQQAVQQSTSQSVTIHVSGVGAAVHYAFNPSYHNTAPPLDSTVHHPSLISAVSDRREAVKAVFAVSPPTPPHQLSAPFPVRLLLVRHGESESNAAPHLIAGQSTHVPLTVKGRQQALALATTLRQRRYHASLVLASDAVRCRQTLEALQLDPPPRSLYTSPQLREQSQGQWEGLVRADVHTAEVKAAMRQHSVRFSVPGGESIADAAYRAYAFIMQAITREAPLIAAVDEAGVDVLVVCHAQVIRGLVWLLCGVRDEYAWRLGCDNCSMTELHIDSEGVRLVRLNDAAHLHSLPTTAVSGSQERGGAAVVNPPPAANLTETKRSS